MGGRLSHSRHSRPQPGVTGECNRTAKAKAQEDPSSQVAQGRSPGRARLNRPPSKSPRLVHAAALRPLQTQEGLPVQAMRGVLGWGAAETGRSRPKPGASAASWGGRPSCSRHSRPQSGVSGGHNRPAQTNPEQNPEGPSSQDAQGRSPGRA